jgi:hypothetical protein
MFAPEQTADFMRRNAPISADDAREECETPGQKISNEIGKSQIIQMLAAAGGI